MAENRVNMADTMLKREIIELLGGEQAITRENRRRGVPRGTRLRARSRGDRVAEERALYGRGRTGSVAPSNLGASPFRIAAVDHLAERLDVAPGALLAVLGIAGRTAQRRRQQGVLSSDESDRLYRVARVLQRAFEVFAAEDSALAWFKQPQPFFEYHAPLELVGTDAGTQAVEQELGRIEYGDFS